VDHVRKDKIAGLVQNADRDLQDQKAKIADHAPSVDHVLLDRRVKTADRVQKDKIVQKDQLQ
jgi:hypothetical protein